MRAFVLYPRNNPLNKLMKMADKKTKVRRYRTNLVQLSSYDIIKPPPTFEIIKPLRSISIPTQPTDEQLSVTVSSSIESAVTC